ncbi:MAG: hypothetical protein ABIR87_01600 [Sphingomicrobium sp.]
MPVPNRFATWIAASLIIAAGPSPAQDTAISAAAQGPQTVEGATPDRVKLVEACGGHKFESLVEIDPVKHRSTRIKLCSKPGASDADWVKTLDSAILQIEQRNMPPAAKDRLIAELKIEMSNYAKPGLIAQGSTTGGPSIDFGKRPVIEAAPEPQVPFQTSIVPPLPDIKVRRAAAISAAASIKPIRASVRCLERGESGKGSTCDYLGKNSVLVLTAIGGLDKGGSLRFLRKGEDQGSVEIDATPSGQSRRVALPSGICKGLAQSKVEILMLAPGSTSAGGRLGPYALRC